MACGVEKYQTDTFGDGWEDERVGRIPTLPFGPWPRILVPVRERPSAAIVAAGVDADWNARQGRHQEERTENLHLQTVVGEGANDGADRIRTDVAVSRAGVAGLVTFADIVATDRRTNAAISRADVAVFVTFADIVTADRLDLTFRHTFAGVADQIGRTVQMFPDVDPDLVVVRAEGIGSVCLATLRSPFALVVGQGTVGRTARRGLIFVAGPIAAEGQTDSAVSRTVLTELPITADIVAAVNRTAATIFGAGVTTLVTVAGSIPTEGTDTTVSRAGVAVFVTFADIVATDRRTNAAIRRAGVAVFVTFADIVATDRRTNAAIRCAVVAAFMLVAGSIPTEGTDTAVSRAGVA
ncbi:TPA: hypothetical protein DEP86_00905, partial [Candidatus Uhrbacteria bacterium]|nr:hypothetical protein [Candidatus Uhrbacteria bacterium]